MCVCRCRLSTTGGTPSSLALYKLSVGVCCVTHRSPYKQPAVRRSSPATAPSYAGRDNGRVVLGELL